MRRNGTLVGVKPGGGEVPLDVPPLALMSAAEIEASAARDGDNPPLTDAPAGKLRRIPRVKTKAALRVNRSIPKKPRMASAVVGDKSTSGWFGGLDF